MRQSLSGRTQGSFVPMLPAIPQHDHRTTDASRQFAEPGGVSASTREQIVPLERQSRLIRIRNNLKLQELLTRFPIASARMVWIIAGTNYVSNCYSRLRILCLIHPVPFTNSSPDAVCQVILDRPNRMRWRRS